MEDFEFERLKEVAEEAKKMVDSAFDAYYNWIRYPFLSDPFAISLNRLWNALGDLDRERHAAVTKMAVEDQQDARKAGHE